MIVNKNSCVIRTGKKFLPQKEYSGSLWFQEQLNETSALEEMEIVENGPELAHAGNIIASAMDNYWKEKSSDGKWHFCHKTDDIRTYNKNSKVVQKFMTAKLKLAFMK